MNDGKLPNTPCAGMKENSADMQRPRCGNTADAIRKAIRICKGIPGMPESDRRTVPPLLKETIAQIEQSPGCPICLLDVNLFSAAYFPVNWLPELHRFRAQVNLLK